MNGVRRLVLSLVVAGASVAHAQSGRSDPAQYERQGRYEEAARAYAERLQGDPANIAALFGLERVLTRLGWLDSIAPFVAAGLAADPRNKMIRELEFRVVSALHGADSIPVVVQRWIAAVPESPTPYRQWAFWHMQHGDLESAKAVLEEGRARLGDERLMEYTAQLLAASGDWRGAARQWRAAVEANESLLPAAGSGLSQAPRALRDSLLEVVLEEGSDLVARRLAAELLVRWDRPGEAWAFLDSALPEDRASAVVLLRRFADRARQVPTSAGARARGYALERLTEYVSGPEAARTRLAAARAFADAGDLAAARRMLDRLQSVTHGRRTDRAAAMATLIRVLADAGRVEEAEQRLHEWRSELSGDDVLEIRERLAWGWVVRGKLERAERVLEGDATIGAQAVRGWIALYRGDLEGARTRFLAAGPTAESREEATRRSAMLVLLERLPVMSLPPLGEALLELPRGDTAKAVRKLRKLARVLAPDGGRAELLVLAGELAFQSGDYESAEPVLLEAVAADSAGPAAPSANYGLAAVYAKLGRTDQAVVRLEYLILSYPESALVPQARRLLDEVRGMIPKS